MDAFVTNRCRQRSGKPIKAETLAKTHGINSRTMDVAVAIEKACKAVEAEINEEAWATLHSAVSRPFPKPDSGRIAVKDQSPGGPGWKVFRVA